MSLCRQNYHEECEAGINKQINLELYASYVYMSMAYHFDRDDVALPGFHKFMMKQSNEEREHAQKLMKYQNQRGGRVVLQDIKKPERDEWGTGLEACQAALDLEKHVNQALLDLHKVADTHNDPQMSDFIEDYLNEQVESIKEISELVANLKRMMDFIEENYLEEQVESIKQFSEYVTNLKRVGPGLGEYQFDKLTLKDD
ncbi:hypothetical protein ACROYT_G029702 [Oculina patagonica]